MKSIIIVGAGQFGRSVIDLLNRTYYIIMAFADNNKDLQGTTLKTALGPVPILSMQDAISYKPDIMLISVTDEARGLELEHQIRSLGYRGDILFLRDLYQIFDIRSATLHRLAERIKSLQIPGSVAELGVYKGDIAWQLNILFPNRKLILFDTFEGFDKKDIETEFIQDYSHAKEGDFADTSIDYVRQRMFYPLQVCFRKGYFPETSIGLENERYSLVSLDADLYEPILSGLEYFYPRLNKGGMILLHDYNNSRFRGAKQAVADYESKHESLFLIPLCDLHGTAVIIRN